MSTTIMSVTSRVLEHQAMDRCIANCLGQISQRPNATWVPDIRVKNSLTHAAFGQLREHLRVRLPFLAEIVDWHTDNGPTTHPSLRFPVERHFSTEQLDIVREKFATLTTFATPDMLEFMVTSSPVLANSALSSLDRMVKQVKVLYNFHKGLTRHIPLLQREVDILNILFQLNPNPNRDEIQMIADNTWMYRYAVVKNWFHRKRLARGPIAADIDDDGISQPMGLLGAHGQPIRAAGQGDVGQAVFGSRVSFHGGFMGQGDIS